MSDIKNDTIKRIDAVEAVHDYWKQQLDRLPKVQGEYGEVLDGDYDSLLTHNKELSTRIKAIPSADRPSKVIAQITFDEEKLREIVKEAVERFKEEYEITDRPQGDYNKGYCDAVQEIADEMVKQGKHIEADRPQGKWIGEADGYYNGELIYDTWYCSNCDYVVDDEEPPTWNFCPNCGARMKGKDNE